MTDYPFNSDSDQSERRAALRQGSTFKDFAQSDLAEAPGGRFKQSDLSNRYTVGSTLVPEYKGAVPDWVADRGPPEEPPLGFSVDQMEPTGETAEIERSIQKLECAGHVNANVHQEQGAAVAPASPSSGGQEVLIPSGPSNSADQSISADQGSASGVTPASPAPFQSAAQIQGDAVAAGAGSLAPLALKPAANKFKRRI